MKSERGQSAVLVGLLLIFVVGAVFMMLVGLPGMKQGADAIAEELVNIDTVVSAHVNEQRIYPNKHAKESHGEYEATLATNCYNDHGVFFIQASPNGDWYFHCLEEDNKTVRTTIWTRVGNQFHLKTAYTKGDGAWSWTKIRTFFESKWNATKATFPQDGVLYIDNVPAPFSP